MLGDGGGEPWAHLRFVLQRRGRSGHPPDADRAAGCGRGPHWYVAALLRGGPWPAVPRPAGRGRGDIGRAGRHHAPCGKVREAHRRGDGFRDLRGCAPRAEDVALLHRAFGGGRGLPPGRRGFGHRPHRLRRRGRLRDGDAVAGAHPPVWRVAVAARRAAGTRDAAHLEPKGLSHRHALEALPRRRSRRCPRRHLQHGYHGRRHQQRPLGRAPQAARGVLREGFQRAFHGPDRAGTSPHG
mmetsp:Transcript_102165/g.288582  ORF Transcript_102165/g.288582 Transcript_102165/m.288582 type:complete len:240 (+) Transcript_102165:1578-2297(+)